MNRIFQKVLASEIFPALVILVLCLWLQGCQESVKSQNTQNVEKADSNPDDSDFAKGANRPPTVKTLYSLAEILSKQGKDAQAETMLQKITQEHPEFLPAWNSLAEAQMRQHQIDKAVITLSNAQKFRPNDPVILNNLGMCYMIQQDYNKALEMFTAAAAIKPENARYRANMAVSLAFLSRDDEAMSLYKQILRDDQAEHNLNVIRAARAEKLKETSPSTESVEKN